MRNTYIMATLLCLSLLGVVGFVSYKEISKKSTSTDARVAGEQTEKSSEVANSSAGTLTPQSNEGTIPLKVGGSTQSNTQNVPQNQPALLTPDQFGEYDSYVTSDKYLRLDSKVGTGAEAVEGKKVAVYYKGWLTNGQVFDESRADESGTVQPFIFTPGKGEVIVGWDQGILGMKVGGTRRLVLPPQAAYGEQGQGSIPPNSVLIFDIQLLEVEK